MGHTARDAFIYSEGFTPKIRINLNKNYPAARILIFPRIIMEKFFGVSIEANKASGMRDR